VIGDDWSEDVVALLWVYSPAGDAHPRESAPPSSHPTAAPLAGSPSCADEGGAMGSPSRSPSCMMTVDPVVVATMLNPALKRPRLTPEGHLSWAPMTSGRVADWGHLPTVRWQWIQ
jgi:hypothetical protein